MELFYRKFGEGHPLIIVHGLYGSSDNWVSIAHDLANYFEVYIIDQRNHGRSPHSPTHSYELMKSDLHYFMEAHNLARAILLGHSMGGKTVMHFAAEFPEKVSSLIVLDIAPKSYKANSNYDTQALQHIKLVEAMLAVNFVGVTQRSHVEEQLEAYMPDIRVRKFLMKNVYKNKQGTLSWRLNIQTISNNLERILDGNEVANGNEPILGFPVLFVRGGNSNYVLDSDLDHIQTVFPYANLKTIANAGHWLHAEQPEALLKTIKSFILD